MTLNHIFKKSIGGYELTESPRLTTYCIWTRSNFATNVKELIVGIYSLDIEMIFSIENVPC